MQRPDEHKRGQITAAAAQLFARRPYHEVTLDAVAAAAKVGKGTLYVYFASKEQLYGALIDDSFARVIAELRQQLDGDGHTAKAALAVVIEALLRHARRFPHLFHLMRAGQQLPCHAQLVRRRTELMQLVLAILRRGVRAGELRDAHPELTATYLPALVRAAVLYGPTRRSAKSVADHILSTICNGIAPARERARPPRTRPPTRPPRR